MNITFESFVLVFVIVLIIVVGFIYLYNSSYESNEKQKAIKVKENQQKKVEKFYEKENLTKNLTKNVLTNKLENIDNNKELYELYFKGVNDTYDLNGVRIPGVEPNAEKAIMYLQKLIYSPKGTKKDVLNLAKIYHQGMHKFEPDLDKAEDIYNSLANDQTISEDIQQQVMEGLADIHKIRVYKWLNLPLENEVEINETNHLPDELTGDIIVDNEVFNINEIIIAQQALEEQRRNEATEEAERGTKQYNDPQNTHNSQVLSTIRASLDKLKNTKQNKSNEQCYNEIKVYLQGLTDSDKQNDALRSLNVVKTRNEIVSGAGGEHEMDALSLVWNRIHDSDRFNSETKQNLRETMFDELASMQEHGVTVCATGRITRIIDTLNGVDEDVSIKPTYAINEEMMNKSASIRERLLSEETDEDRLKYEAGTHAKQEDFDKKLKDTIISELKKDYVDTKILSLSNFNTEIKKWIEFI